MPQAKLSSRALLPVGNEIGRMLTGATMTHEAVSWDLTMPATRCGMGEKRKGEKEGKKEREEREVVACAESQDTI